MDETRLDKIEIKELEVFANHGVYPEENVLGQKFVISATLFTRTRLAGLTDELSASINYGEVSHMITDFTRKHTYKLLESLAENLAEMLLCSLSGLEKITLKIEKPWAPVGLPLKTVSVEITRKWHTAYIASAQVKSCILLAGLYAEGETSVTEPILSRNHTELMLKEFGADIRTVHQLAGSEATSVIQPCQELHGQKITVPGDISSAAYFIAAGLLVPDSEILVKNVGINPTRAGLLKVCEDMGGDITLLNERTEAGEKMADILVRSSQLHGISIHGDIIPTLIDEIPIIAVMAACAEGTTIIRDAQELRVKETDRIETITDNLIAMGCSVLPTEDGMVIKGGEPLKGATIHTLLDHRIAMAFSIAALVADGRTKILDSHCIDVSYPGFYDAFEHLL